MGNCESDRRRRSRRCDWKEDSSMESEDEGGKGGEQADRSTALIPIVRILLGTDELG